MDDSQEARLVGQQNETVADVAQRQEVEQEEFDDDGFSLEELSRSYATAMGKPASTAVDDDQGSLPGIATDDADSEFEDPGQGDSSSQNAPPTPRTILEAILFVGRPDGGVVSATEIAALMRGVRDSEISNLVDELNAEYIATNRALRIVAHGAGYRLQLSDDLSFMKDLFYGRVREVRLNQASIDCLALISYQPGVSREKLEEQLGRPSGAVLNQLVRRQLLEFRREHDGKQLKQRYYPTDRLLELIGIQSLDDLPQAEDFE